MQRQKGMAGIQRAGNYTADGWRIHNRLAYRQQHWLKGSDGKMYTKGSILQIEPAKLLLHNLVDMQDGKLLSVITYRFANKNGYTVLEAEEDIRYATDQEQLAAIAEGWDRALEAVKTIAEKL